MHDCFWLEKKNWMTSAWIVVLFKSNDSQMIAMRNCLKSRDLSGLP